MINKNPKAYIDEVIDGTRGHLSRLIMQWLPNGTKEGDEWSSINPTRADAKKGSFKVNLRTGSWADFATGDGGHDLVSLYYYLNGTAKMLDAAIQVGKILGIPNPFEIPEKKPSGPGRPPDKYRCYTHPGQGIPHEAYAMRRAPNEDGTRGEVVVVECVFRNKDNIKTIRFYNWQEKAWNCPPNNLPLYNSEDIHATISEGIPVAFFEGPKVASVVRKILRKMYGDDPKGYPFIPSAWIGGSNQKAIQKMDWSQITGRFAYIVPDCDEPGRRAARYLSDELLAVRASRVEILDPGNKPKGWDFADFDENLDGPFDRYWASLLERGLDPAQYRVVGKAADAEKLSDAAVLKNIPVRPFRCLGFDDPEDKQTPTYYFYSAKTQTIIRRSSQDLSQEYKLLELAGYQYWEDNYAGGSKTKMVDWKAAGRHLLAECQAKGVIDISEIRYGLGCWKHKDKLLIHGGDRVLVEEEWVKLGEACITSGPATKHMIFEQQKSLELGDPIEGDRDDIELLREIMRRFSWRGDKDLSADIFIGWCASAPWCGVFDWRPHMCLTGGAGAGKTTASRDVAAPMLEPFGIAVEANTTEPGLRRRLGNRALPVRFEEMEAETGRRGGDTRQEQILRLARSASSESGARIHHGDNRTYLIRTMILASCIQLNLPEAADRQRWFILELESNTDTDKEQITQWRAIHSKLLQRLPHTLGQDIFWRLWGRRDAFVSALESFREAGSGYFGSARIGDQVAPPMATLYVLLHADRNTRSVSVVQARAFLAGYEGWEVLLGDVRLTDFDELIEVLWSIPMQSGITTGHALRQIMLYEEKGGNHIIDTTLHRMRHEKKDEDEDGNEDIYDAFRAEVGTYGLRIMQLADKTHALAVSTTTSSQLEKQLSNTKWMSATTRKNVLKQERRTEAIGPTHFAGLSRSCRAVIIPWSVIEDLEKKPAAPVAEIIGEVLEEFDDRP